MHVIALRAYYNDTHILKQPLFNHSRSVWLRDAAGGVGCGQKQDMNNLLGH